MSDETRQIRIFRQFYDQERRWVRRDLLVTFPARSTVRWEANQGTVTITREGGEVIAAYRGTQGFCEPDLIAETKPEGEQ